MTMLTTLVLAVVCMTSTSHALAPLSHVAHNLWVGNQHGAADVAGLAAANITAVLNVAWDLDIEYPPTEYVGSVPDDNERLILEYVKVGLVDGDGNTLYQMAAAVFQLTQLFARRTLQPKDATTYPNPPPAVLCHCHSGMSRSVTVAAVYLRFAYPSEFRSFDAALHAVITPSHDEH